MQNRNKLAPLAVVLLAFVLTGCASSYQDDFDMLEQVQAAKSAKIDLAQAADIASRAAKGIPVEIRFHSRPVGPYYAVKLLESEATNYVVLDANSGSILTVERKWHQVPWLKRRNRSERVHTQNADVSLSDAIAKAEAITGGKAVEMTVDNQRNPQAYQISSIHDGEFSTTKIGFRGE
ncbi:MAG: PepSY domain-containing protein [Parvibaculum sp.]|nr:PepSY domain-containing protein [Parvibaculum sp.]